MAANFAFISKVVFLLGILLVVVQAYGRSGGRGSGGRHRGDHGGRERRCQYPRDCTNSSSQGEDDRILNTTAIFNPTTLQCESTEPTSGPRDCTKFVTLEACQRKCGNVTQP